MAPEYAKSVFGTFTSWLQYTLRTKTHYYGCSSPSVDWGRKRCCYRKKILSVFWEIKPEEFKSAFVWTWPLNLVKRFLKPIQTFLVPLELRRDNGWCGGWGRQWGRERRQILLNSTIVKAAVAIKRGKSVTLKMFTLKRAHHPEVTSPLLS